MTRRVLSLFTVGVLVLMLPSPVLAWCSLVDDLMDRWLFAPPVYMVMSVALLLHIWLLSQLPVQSTWVAVLIRILAFGLGVTLVLAIGASPDGYCHCLS